MAATVKFNHLPAVRKALDVGMAQAVNQTAVRVRDAAKELVPSLDNPGPFATGALQASIHVVTEERSDYYDAIIGADSARMSAADPDDRQPLEPFINPPITIHAPRGWTIAAVVAPLNYAYRVEMGGFSSRYAPRAAGPFMRPAALMERQAFARRARDVVKSLESFTGAAPVVVPDTEDVTQHVLAF